MPENSGKVQGVGPNDYLQFYLGRDVSIDPRCPFDAGDSFDVHVVAGAGIILTPTSPSNAVTLADLLVAIDAPGRLLEDTSIDPETIPLTKPSRH